MHGFGRGVSTGGHDTFSTLSRRRIPPAHSPKKKKSSELTAHSSFGEIDPGLRSTPTSPSTNLSPTSTSSISFLCPMPSQCRHPHSSTIAPWRLSFAVISSQSSSVPLQTQTLTNRSLQRTAAERSSLQKSSDRTHLPRKKTKRPLQLAHGILLCLSARLVNEWDPSQEMSLNVRLDGPQADVRFAPRGQLIDLLSEVAFKTLSRPDNTVSSCGAKDIMRCLSSGRPARS